MKNLPITGAMTGKHAFSLSKMAGAPQDILLQLNIQKLSMTLEDSSKYLKV
jgi:hypothetical protein